MEIPRAWAHSLRWAAAAHGPFTMAFSTSLQACWHLIVQMYQDSGDPLSCCHFRIGRPWLPTLGSPPRVESWSLCPRLSLLLFSLLSHPSAASATTTASHIQTPHQRQRVGWPVTLREEPQVRPPHGRLPQGSPVVLQPQNTLWLLLSADT